MAVQRYQRRFGHQAEEWVIDLLQKSGVKVIASGESNDVISKIDFWAQDPESNRWLPFQFTVDKMAAFGAKGLDALKRGVLISWLPDCELEEWAMSRNVRHGEELTEKFWSQAHRLMSSFSGFQPQQLIWN
jgi:hypothetical protein